MVPVPDKLEKQVRAQLEVAILKHSDQLKGLQVLCCLSLLLYQIVSEVSFF